MRPLTSLRNLFFAFFTVFAAFCAPGQMPPGASGVTGLCSSRVSPWADCKTRCLPSEDLYAQCTSKQGVIFSTRSGLQQVQTYGFTYEPEARCGGVASVRIWHLTRIYVSRATAGYMSLPSSNSPDCTNAYLHDIDVDPDRIYYSGVDVTASQAVYLDSMATPITPASPTQIVQTFNAPADGDIATAASVNVAFQSLENSVEALRFLTYGGGFYPRVKATSNTVMTIQPLGAVVVKQAGVWAVVPHTVATTIDPLALAGGAFAANTRYYVYVNLVAGVITWSVSTTAPDAGWRYKTGDEQYQFVSTFYADTGPNLIPYTQSGKTYLTKKFSTATVQLSGGNATVPTAVSFSTYVPTNASSVLLQIAFIPNADQASAYVYSYDLSSVTLWGDAASGTNNIYAQVSASTLDGGFGYVVSNVGDELNVYALGFTL